MTICPGAAGEGEAVDLTVGEGDAAGDRGRDSTECSGSDDRL